MEHKRVEHLGEELEGESSSTSTANLVTGTTISNALQVDQTEAQSTTVVLLSSAQEMVEVSTPHFGQQINSGTSLSNQTSPAASSVHLYAPAVVEGAQGEGFRNMNIDQDMMNFIPQNHHDASSQMLFQAEAAAMGSLSNNGSQQGAGIINAESSYNWAVNGYNQFSTSDPFPLAPTPTAIHLSNPQASMGGGNCQYPPGFLQTQSPEPWFPLNKINLQHHSSTTFGAEEIQFQGLMNQGPPNGNFYTNNGPSTIPFPQTRMNLQDGLPSSSNLHLSTRNWISEGHGLSANPPTSRSIRGRNAVYDPTYESMGLPIDPHLRMFLTRRDSTGHDQM